MRVKVISEIGINHNGSLDIAKKLIDVAAAAGCDFVKFQKRTPDVCVPEHQKNVMRDTPWGQMTYLQYRHKVEFGKKEYDEIARYCTDRKIEWTASVWDDQSVEFLSHYDIPFIKIPSACALDDDLIDYASMFSKLVISTGMCDEEAVSHIIKEHGDKLSCLMHCVSTYPSKPEEQNLECISWMRSEYPHIDIGFSNHASGLVFIAPAVALGARWVEFHVTMDRSMWGTDQSASIEPEGVFKAVKYIRVMEKALGDGNKRIQEAEIPIMNKLRRVG